MCIIVFKPAGEPMPSKKILRTCFQANPDGAGFMFARGGDVHIYKGYMIFRDFWVALQKQQIRASETCAIHFRIATSGGTRPENCHPFPLSFRESELRALKIRADMAIVHNGVLGTGEYHLSDTQVFVRDILSHAAFKTRLFEDELTHNWLEEYTHGNRLCILRGDGDFVLFGDWHDDRGVLYSNTTYKPFSYAAWDKKWGALRTRPVAHCPSDFWYDFENDVDDAPRPLEPGMYGAKDGTSRVRNWEKE